jgi:Zn-dependent protease with chaperone function
VRWCPACLWNAHPGATTAKTRGDRFGRRLNRAAELRLYQRISTAGTLHAARDGAWLTATVVAGLVHLVSAAIAGIGVYLLTIDALPSRVVGGLLLLIAFGSRPRLGSMRRIRKRTLHLSRAEAPTLFALTDRVAAELGTAPLRLICFNGRFNASYQRVGFRREPVLTLGLPFWELLTPQQQLALLGHELGHGANGDSSHGIWVGSALNTLSGWYGVLSPGRWRGGSGGSRSVGGGMAVIGEMVARVLMFVLAELVLLLHLALRRATVLGNRRGEYLADSLAARVAGIPAAEDMLKQLTLNTSLAQVLQQRKFRSGTVLRGPDGKVLPKAAAEPVPDLWAALRSYVDTIPESERARRLVVSALDDSATDSTHPPSHLRLDYLRGLPSQTDPVIVPSGEEIEAVRSELAGVRRAVAGRLE